MFYKGLFPTGQHSSAPKFDGMPSFAPVGRETSYQPLIPPNGLHVGVNTLPAVTFGSATSYIGLIGHPR